MAETSPTPSSTPPSPPAGTPPSYLAQEGMKLCLAAIGLLTIARWLVILGGAAAIGALFYYNLPQ